MILEAGVVNEQYKNQLNKKYNDGQFKYIKNHLTKDQESENDAKVGIWKQRYIKLKRFRENKGRFLGLETGFVTENTKLLVLMGMLAMYF